MTPRRLRTSLAEADSAPGQGVDSGRGVGAPAVAADFVGPQRVDDDQDNVGWDLWRGPAAGRAEATQEQEQRQAQLGEPRVDHSTILYRGLQASQHVGGHVASGREFPPGEWSLGFLDALLVDYVRVGCYRRVDFAAAGVSSRSLPAERSARHIRKGRLSPSEELVNEVGGMGMAVQQASEKPLAEELSSGCSPTGRTRMLPSAAKLP